MGQVGDGTLTTIVSSPAAVQGLVGARTVVAGDEHSCALMGDGSVYCWGANNLGQLGMGSRSPTITPVQVVGVQGAVALSAGAQHTCAILDDDTVRCWGANERGQLGSGTPGEDGASPLVVGPLSGRPSQIGSTSTASCVLVGGNVECWGYVPDAGEAVAPLPRALNVQNVVQLGAGPSSFCFAFLDGTISCSPRGWLGDAASDDATLDGGSSPSTVQGLDGKRWVGFGRGDTHTCLLDDSGLVSCWGSNFYGQLGDSSGTGNRSIASSVPGLSGILAVAAAGSHTCVVAGDGSVLCWGINGSSQLGTGDEAASSAVPTRVQGW
jgi:alpha-tubulin suppressor-like RCC1 family protein